MTSDRDTPAQKIRSFAEELADRYGSKPIGGGVWHMQPIAASTGGAGKEF